MTIQVARRYRFAASHVLPDLAPPWCDVHRHQYTVEVVADSDPLVDTDRIDAAWAVRPDNFGEHLNDTHADTTVEGLAREWLTHFQAQVPQVVRVTVWEDNERWGMANGSRPDPVGGWPGAPSESRVPWPP